MKEGKGEERKVMKIGIKMCYVLEPASHKECKHVLIKIQSIIKW